MSWLNRPGVDVGPFATFVDRIRPDGTVARWESRRHRKHPPGALAAGSTWWAPRSRGWWIAILFAVGSLLFALGAVPGYASAVGARWDAVTFFIGSLFFTAAGFLTYREAVDAGPQAPAAGRRRFFVFQPRRIDWWATAVQLAGTLFFNVSTGNAVRVDLTAKAANQHVWRPDAVGSVCFLVASALAWFEVCHGWTAWRPRSWSWWITLLNLAGSVAFGVSAVAGYISPATGQLHNAERSNLGTLIGAVCFFAGALLLLPERTEEASALVATSGRQQLRHPPWMMTAAGMCPSMRETVSPDRGESTMPLHERDTVRHQMEDCVFVGRDLTAPVPKYRFPPDETAPKEAFQVVSDELMLDGNSRQNLATFCQTWVEPEVFALMALAIDKNMIDKDEYPQTAEIEQRCVHMLADLWHAPEAANTVGASAIGSSEACMLAGMAAKWRWRARRQAEGKPTDKPNMVCGPVQVVWHKFARYWDIEMREVPMSPGHYMMDQASMLDRVDENTIMVVPTLGVTYTGAYEPVAALAAALDQLQADTGLDIPIHVDGASGAFLAPFCAPDLLFDFRLPRVKSISASGHKFGLAPLGVGWVLWRDREELPDELIFHVNYLGGDMPVFQINFSRPAGQIIAQYYNFIRLGFEGYKRIHDASYAVGQYLAGEIVKLGPFELLCDSDPATGIPTVTWRIREGEDPGYTLFDLADRLRLRGWQVPAYTLTGTASDIPVQRILVRLGVSQDMASLLLDDFRDALAHFGKHPVAVPMSKEESTGFNHL